MKISASAADRFVDQPDGAVTAVLLYGPDRGLVQERAERLALAVVETLDDPFRVVDLNASVFSSDPARLIDEAAAQSLMGGRRVVRVRGAGNDLAPIIETLLEHGAGDSLIIVEAGELAARAKLRSVFEKASNAAAIACYPDDEAALETVIRDTLKKNDLSVSRDALAYMASRLGTDRKITLSELDKLVSYMGGATEVTEADAMACIGDSAEIDLDDLVDAVAGGDHAKAARALGRLYNDGVNAIAILRALQRHFQRLHLAGSFVASGTPIDAAINGLKPPVFFKRRPAFRRQLRAWPSRLITSALDLLLDAELDCKTTGMPGNAICAQTITRLTQAAARGNRGAA